MSNPPRLRGTLLAFALFIAFSLAIAQTQPTGETRTTASGLKIVEVKKQTEPLLAQAGDYVWVHYTGTLESNGKKFDSSMDHPGDPIGFRLGIHQVIAGWDEGVAGMRVGDKRHLVIPPNLAYGPEGTGASIPPNSTLVFDIELVGIYRP